MTICLSIFRGNSPPWYLPEMNRRAQAVSVLDAAIVVRSPYSSPPAKTKLPASAGGDEAQASGPGLRDPGRGSQDCLLGDQHLPSLGTEIPGARLPPVPRKAQHGVDPRICQRSLPVRGRMSAPRLPAALPESSPARCQSAESVRPEPAPAAPPAPSAHRVAEPHPLPAERRHLHPSTRSGGVERGDGRRPLTVHRDAEAVEAEAPGLEGGASRDGDGSTRQLRGAEGGEQLRLGASRGAEHPREQRPDRAQHEAADRGCTAVARVPRCSPVTSRASSAPSRPQACPGGG